MERKPRPIRLSSIERERKRRRDQADREAISKDAEAIRARCEALIGFVEEFWHILEPTRDFVKGWAIEAIALHLEEVSRGNIQYLLINVPPGMMKSLLVSVFWPAWEWATQEAGLGFLTSSFSLENVLRDNAKMRRLIESDKYQLLYGARVARGAKWGEKRFENSSSGVRAGRSFEKMTGGRGDRVIIDDPHDVDGGESDVQRPRAVRTFREAIPDRLNDMSKSAIVVIMQRLHSNDVSGTIKQLRLPYVHLNLPMEFEPTRREGGKDVDNRCRTYRKDGTLLFEDPRQEDGELLFPERFPRDVVEGLKIAKGSYAYAGQYQQRPTSREGGLFKRHWFAGKIIGPAGLPTGGVMRVRAWDFAGSEATQMKQPDWTVGLAMFRDGTDYYVTGLQRDRLSPGAVQKLVISCAETDPVGTVVRLPIDPAQAGKYQAEQYVTALAGFAAVLEKPKGSKVERALPVSVQCEFGHIYLVNSCPPEEGVDPWIEAFLDEVCAFPTGTFDDQVDAFADAFNQLSLAQFVAFSTASAGGRLATAGAQERDSRYRFEDRGQQDQGAGFGSVRSLSHQQGISF